MRTFKYLSDPKALEVIADETRRKIIYLLRAKEQTVSQIADALGKTPQAIYHQIRKLVDAGLVEVAREGRVGHFIETYYRATAEVFEFTHGETRGPEAEKQLGEALEALETLGVSVKADKEALAKMAEIEGKSAKMFLRPELEERISQLEGVGFVTRQHVYKFAQLATMSEKQFEEKQAEERELRDLLTKSLAKPTQKSRK